MAEAMLSANEWTAAEVNGGVDWDRSIFRPGKAAIVKLGDGTWVQIPGSPAGVLPALARLCKREALLNDPRFADLKQRNQHLDASLDAVRELAATFPDFASFESALSDGIRLPVGRITPLAEVPQSDWARARDAFVEVPCGADGEPTLVNRSALRFSNAEVGARGGGRALGSDNRAALREVLGVSESELDALEQAGVLVERAEEPGSNPW